MQGEVAYEILCVGADVVAVSELSVEDKAVVEQPAAEQSLVHSVVKAVGTGGDVSAESPVGATCHLSEDVCELLREGAAEEALDRKSVV